MSAFKEECFSKVYETASRHLTFDNRMTKILRIIRDEPIKARRMPYVGAGDGTCTLVLKDALHCEDVWGVDISKIAVNSLLEQGITAFKIDMDSQDLPFPSKHFDFVFAGESYTIDIRYRSFLMRSK